MRVVRVHCFFAGLAQSFPPDICGQFEASLNSMQCVSARAVVELVRTNTVAQKTEA